MAAASVADPYVRIAELEDLLRQAEERFCQVVDSIPEMTAACYTQGHDDASQPVEDAALLAVTS